MWVFPKGGSYADFAGGGWVWFKESSIKTPAEKIMLADERMTYEFAHSEITSGALGSGWYWPGTASAWEWPYDKITGRHDGKGNVTFADGHVQTVRPEFGGQPEHYDPLY